MPIGREGASLALIDDTARIGKGAELANDAEIGPYCIIGPRVTLGAGVKIGHGVVLGAIPQDLKFKEGTPVGVRVGAGTVIREYVTVSRATKPDTSTDIGSGCLLMTGCHVAHDCRLGDGVIVINYAGITGHCQIGDRATIGGLTGFVPFTRVGTGAYVGGMAKVNADVPPYMLVDGQPATVRSVNVIGLRRAGMLPAERRALQDAYKLLYRSGLGPKRALDRVRDEVPACPAVTTLLEFVATATRHGICGGWEGTRAAREAVPVESADGERED